MPILDVDLVVGRDEALPTGLARILAEACAEAFDAPPGRTWVRIHTTTSDRYGEDDGGPPGGGRPVFVRVLMAHAPTGADRVAHAATLADVIAAGCRRPVERVHVLYEPDAAGRLAFGGQLLEE